MPEKTITLTRQQFIEESAASGLVGAWKFWQELKMAQAEGGTPVSEAMDKDAKGILTIIGTLGLQAIAERRWAMSPQEQAAYKDLGLIR